MEEQAAQDPNMPELDIEVEPQAEPIETKLEGQAETAPAIVEETGFVETENDKVQKRINKITAEKYAEKRRADEAERKLTEQAAQPLTATTQNANEPKLEDFDYDDAAFNSALIDFKVNLKADEIQQQQKQQVQQQEQQTTQNNFQQKVVEFEAKAADYQTVVANIPQLPPETLDAVMQSDKGPELAYYLGKHLDVADEVATMSPMAAAMRLGQISAQLTAKPKTVNISAAPEPIEPVGSSSVINKSQEDMSMDEIFNM